MTGVIVAGLEELAEVEQRLAGRVGDERLGLLPHEHEVDERRDQMGHRPEQAVLLRPADDDADPVAGQHSTAFRRRSVPDVVDHHVVPLTARDEVVLLKSMTGSR